ncbi:hypothetical protein PR202_ga28674 [Eleusine coracana subsp. coracana]|uniref:THH1/TOM1/TOM3 domain-containing protein n=1 Tax=Eleusine coracana subsp. coracana TaxID=191504 RepID=A0AAV5DIU8_ELECO|nr:hypothetical protein PR202_ga28674 [Eleusine coracana subsp. coracana]
MGEPRTAGRPAALGLICGRLLPSLPSNFNLCALSCTGCWSAFDCSLSYSYLLLFAGSSPLALLSLQIQLIRIQRRVPEFGWTTQKVFHLMNFLVNGVRAVVFGFHVHVFLLPTKVYKLVLLDLPGLLFFSTYTLLVLFWAEIYHQARSLPTDKLRPAYIAVNGIVYVIQVCIWIYLGINDNALVELVSKLFIVAVSLSLFLASQLFFLLRRFPIESKGRQKKLYEVGTVTAICVTCFLIRCVVVALSAFDPEVSLEVLDHPVLDFFYYMLAEILPSALVLFILRKLPPKRVSAQYHPIN